MDLNYLLIPSIKPSNISSTNFLNYLKKIILKKFNYQTKSLIKFGHSGTLDPFAAGLLLVLSGKACKLNFLFNIFPKEYIAVIKFGEKRDTGDITGNLIGHSEIPSKELFETLLNNYKGKIFQKPHKFSAVKIDGKRAYELARKNIEFDLEEKEVFIYDNKLLYFNPKINKAVIYIKCSSGTYIRKYVEDLLIKENYFGFCEKLVRISIGPFNIKDIKKNSLNFGFDFMFLNLNKNLFEKYFNCISLNSLNFEEKNKLKNILKNGLKLDKINLSKINLDKIKFDNRFSDDLLLIFNENDILSTILKKEEYIYSYLFNYPEIL